MQYIKRLSKIWKRFYRRSVTKATPLHIFPSPVTGKQQHRLVARKSKPCPNLDNLVPNDGFGLSGVHDWPLTGCVHSQHEGGEIESYKAIDPVGMYQAGSRRLMCLEDK